MPIDVYGGLGTANTVRHLVHSVVNRLKSHIVAIFCLMLYVKWFVAVVLQFS